jgi:hypothetical protein
VILGEQKSGRGLSPRLLIVAALLLVPTCLAPSTPAAAPSTLARSARRSSATL